MDGDKFTAQVAEFLRRENLFGAKILVACSGGPDSLALLYVLAHLREKFALTLAVAHFEHGLRGAVGQNDAAFTENTAAKLNLPCRIGHGDTRCFAKAHRLSVETAARELRWEFLRRAKTELGCDYIAAAHHLNDQAETVLMRIFHGTGTDGLAAMRGRQGDIIRPLLTLTRAEIESYCEQLSLSPCYDVTNDMTDCTRNRIRLQLLPQLRQNYNPQVDMALARLADIAAADSDYIARTAVRLWPQATRTVDGNCELSRDFLGRQHIAVQRAIIRRWAHLTTGVSEGWQQGHYEALRQLLLCGESGQRTTLPGHRYGVINYGWLSLRQEVGSLSPFAMLPQDIALSGRTVTSWGTFTALRVYGMPRPIGRNEIYIDSDKLPGALGVRCRRDGDIMRTAGGRQTLKKIFQAARIDADQRQTWPVVTAGETILWLPGIRRSSLAYVDENTANAVKLEFAQGGNTPQE